MFCRRLEDPLSDQKSVVDTSFLGYVSGSGLLQACHFRLECLFHGLFLPGWHKAIAPPIQDDLVDGIEVEVEGIGQQLHLVVERSVEQRRIIGVDRDGYAGGVQARDEDQRDEHGRDEQAEVDAQVGEVAGEGLLRGADEREVEVQF